MKKNKIVSRAELKGIIRDLKKQGKRIVFTNGCFDIVHAGHVRYLKEAGGLGDVLIIGLNTDNSVSRIKPGRPVIPQDQRAEVISAFSVVDYITFFEEETPYDLIKEIQPDVLVKGSDWKEEDIVGGDIAGRVHTVPYVSGLSTSKIINKIKNLK